MSRPKFPLLAFASAMAACGGGSDAAEPEDDGCDLSITLTGALQASSTGHVAACFAAFGIYDPGPRPVDLKFELGGGVAVSFTLVMSEGSKGLIPATVTIGAEDPPRGWRTLSPAACTIDVTEDAVVGEIYPGALEYRVVGSGACKEAAVAGTPSTTGTVLVGDFAFRGKLFWRQP